MSDEGKNWKFRPPPRISGGSETYRLCSTWREEGACKFGLQCANAHSVEEMQEWKERLEFRQKKAKKAAKLYESFNDLLVEKLSLASNIANVSIACF